MAYFGTTRDKKSHDHDVGEKAKNHGFRLSGAFWRVNGKLGVSKFEAGLRRLECVIVECQDRRDRLSCKLALFARNTLTSRTSTAGYREPRPRLQN